MDPNFNMDINDTSSFKDEDVTNDIIKVIGVGGGGGNAVNYMYKQQIPHIQFVVCNTDKQALDRSEVPKHVLLGYDITKGLGAGNVPEVGRKCAESSEEEIRALFDDKTEMVFITATMGGGTGTGAAPVVARIAKDCGMLTIGIVTVPFYFEGEKKILKALEGAKELKKHVDALLVINNENLIELYKDWNFFNAFHKADDTLANAARSISEIISDSLYINVDFQDVKTTLKDSGSAIIATAEGEGEHRITQAINAALHSPLLKDHDINTSKRLMLKFMCNKDSDNPIRAEEINEITSFTSKLSGIDVKWGIGHDPSLGDKVKITVAPKGFGSENMSRIKMLPPSAGEDGVKDFVVDTCLQAGANPCPPIVIGVGIGGTFDKAALLAKKALLSPAQEPNEDPYYAQMEAELLERINQLGIGPQGFGGKTTALAVSIRTAPTHIAGLPVAVNVNCHVSRHKEAVL